MEFNQLEVDKRILKAIEDMGFTQMTKVQEQAIPEALSHRDVIGQSQTGTGKTVAFGIPIIQNIDEDDEKVQAIIITPTRELCTQVDSQINALLKYYDFDSSAIYGGEDIGKQIKRLKKRPRVLVATPGRLMDMIDRRLVKTENITTVVIDEADELLSMGFIEDIEKILSLIPNRKFTMLFSATMPDRVKNITTKFMKQPKHIKINPKTVTVDTVYQKYIELSENQKFDALCRLIDIYQMPLCMIFGRTKRRVDELINALKTRGYDVEGIHGDMKQEKREKVIERFKNKQIKILVATDVAARGLDISGVTHVINFDLPQEIESYVHRIGRTGRAGKTGTSITFVHPKEMEFLEEIQKYTKSRVEKISAPTKYQAQSAVMERAKDKIKDGIETERQEELGKIAKNLLEEYDAVDIIISALKLLTKNDKKTAKVHLTFETPLRLAKRYKKASAGYRRKNEKEGSYKKNYHKDLSERRYKKDRPYNGDKKSRNNNFRKNEHTQKSSEK